MGGRSRKLAIERAKERLGQLEALLTIEQRLAISRLAVGEPPPWFIVQRCGWRTLPSDAAEKQALLKGLQVLANA